MTKRIFNLAYGMITLYAVAANGQNFDRLLPPREYQGAAARAARTGVPNTARDALDYRGLRQNVVRRYGTDHLTRPPVRPARSLPPIDSDYRDYDYRDDAIRDYDNRNSGDRGYGYRGYGAPAYDGTGFDEDLRDYRVPPRVDLRERARYESELRYRPEQRGDGPCRDGRCHDDPYSNYRPIGFYHDDDQLVRWQQARYARAPSTPPCVGYQAGRQNTDFDGNYVSKNLYGEPRVFNPDQPVRNLLRYMFP